MVKCLIIDSLNFASESEIRWIRQEHVSECPNQTFQNETSHILLF